MYICFNTDVLCYDDGCHLRKYAQNPQRSCLSDTAMKLASVNIVIDKMHFKGYVDEWCKKNCNPYMVEGLKDVRIVSK
jgi:hypothetical protein